MQMTELLIDSSLRGRAGNNTIFLLAELDRFMALGGAVALLLLPLMGAVIT